MEHLNPIYITINKDKLKYNIQHSFDLCKEKCINLAVVAKSICADAGIIDIINESPVTTIADSRIDNLAKMNTGKTRLLIRPAVPQEAEQVVKYSDASFVTEPATLRALDSAAEAQGLTHDVIIMVDLGDLRDGIMYTDTDRIMELAGYAHASRHLNLAGIATNYNCFLGYLPDKQDMEVLAGLHKMLAPLYDTDTPIVSGANSSSVSLLTHDSDILSDAVNQFRMGEAVMLGRDPADNTLIPGYEHDVFTLHVPLIEIQTKPVLENGSRSDMRRGILAVGKQDLQIEHLLPRDSRLNLLGGCSDECVIDLTLAPEYKVGDTVSFDLEYGALMTAFVSPFIAREYI